MKLPPLNASSSLGSGPIEGLAKKGESIEARPMHQLERKIAPKVLGGQMHNLPGSTHGMHIKALSMKSGGTMGSIMGNMSPIPSGGMGE